MLADRPYMRQPTSDSPRSAAVILVIVCGGLLLGLPVALLFLSGAARPHLNTLFAALTLGIIITGWQALLLAEFGRFSLPALAVVWLLALLIFSYLAWRRWRAARAFRGSLCPRWMLRKRR